jgi:hypothetical protein
MYLGVVVEVDVHIAGAAGARPRAYSLGPLVDLVVGVATDIELSRPV